MPPKAIRHQKIDLSSIISADEPAIDLQLEKYRAASRAFLQTVATYKTQFINEETDSRAKYAGQRKKYAEKSKAIETETNACKVRELELAQELAREADERKDAEISLATFRRQLASLKEKVSAIESELEQYNAIAEELERERRRERDTISMHAKASEPGMRALEEALACIIEGLPSGHLLVRFWRIEASQPQREFNFVLDVHEPGYRVVKSSPPVPTLPVLVDTLNSSKDIYFFILQMRHAFVKLVNT